MRTDVRRPGDKPLGVPLAVLPVFFRHMFNNRAVLARMPAQPPMAGYSVALIENLRHALRQPHLDLVQGKLI
jgi:hypothetical protein